MTLTTPTIHLNGSSRRDLQDGYANAYAALTAALEAVAATGPHGRDYYVQPTGALSAAIEEHRARLAALEGVRDELLELHDACSEPAGYNPHS